MPQAFGLSCAVVAIFGLSAIPFGLYLQYCLSQRPRVGHLLLIAAGSAGGIYEVVAFLYGRNSLWFAANSAGSGRWLPVLVLGTIIAAGLLLGARLCQCHAGAERSPRRKRLLSWIVASGFLLVWGGGLLAYAYCAGRVLQSSLGALSDVALVSIVLLFVGFLIVDGFAGFVYLGVGFLCIFGAAGWLHEKGAVTTASEPELLDKVEELVRSSDESYRELSKSEIPEFLKLQYFGFGSHLYSVRIRRWGDPNAADGQLRQGGECWLGRLAFVFREKPAFRRFKRLREDAYLIFAD